MIRDFNEVSPKIHPTCFIAENSSVIGNVEIGENSSIWYGVVLRGDGDDLIIGKNTNIQDNSVVHVDEDKQTNIGNNVTIGHSTVIHSCTISDNVLVGMGAIVLTNAKIEENVIIGAGSLVPPGKVLEKNSLYIGSPVKFARKLDKKEIKKIKKSAQHYIELSNKY